MKRTSRDNGFHGEPVEKIELDESNIRRRVILVILALVIAGVSIGYGISQLTSSNKGWNVIQVNSSSQINSGNEFTFSYYLGENGSPTAERKALVTLYTRLCEEAYKEFDIYNDYDGYHNLCYLNKHPNEDVNVSDALYSALELLNRYGNRYMFLGPVYENYVSVLYADSDTSAEYFDQYYSEDYYNLYQDVLKFVNDNSKVNVELKGNNIVKLVVSSDYEQFFRENDFHYYLDLNWMRNAFVADYIADGLIENGFTHGNLASHDGYSRVLGDFEYEYNLFDYVNRSVFQAGDLTHDIGDAFVLRKSYPLSELDTDYYIYSDGTIRTPHLRMSDALNADESVRTYVAYSEKKGCAEILMNLIPAYYENSLKPVEESDINSVYVVDGTVYYSSHNDDNMQVYEKYSKIFINN